VVAKDEDFAKNATERSTSDLMVALISFSNSIQNINHRNVRFNPIRLNEGIKKFNSRDLPLIFMPFLNLIQINSYRNISFNKFKLKKDIKKFAANDRVRAIYLTAVKDLYNEWQIMFPEDKNMSNEPLNLTGKLDQPSQEQDDLIPQNKVTPAVSNPNISFSLKNAKVGEPYTTELQVLGETVDKKIIIKTIDFPEDTGLSFISPDDREVTGSPLKHGEYTVQVHYQFQDAKPDDPLIASGLTLFINPDPKSLWQKNEPDPNMPYFKKHEDRGFVKGLEDRVMVAASRRGRSHEHSGTFRDDDFMLASEHGWNILAVADGAGSAKSSRKGSELAVQRSMEYLVNALSIQSGKIEQDAAIWFANQAGSQHSVKSALYETFGRAAFMAVKAIEEEAASKNANTKDYSTTLLLAGHKKLPIGHFFAAYWVGDGGVGVYEKGKNVHLLGEADSGEFAGQTRFLDKQVMTPDDVMKRLRFVIVDEFSALVLMTDGVTDPKFETDNNLANLNKWDELWVELEPILADKETASDNLLKWLEFWSPGNHDDRTIALLY
jgi:serine/threonine protein phosphatase PrpC